MTQTVKLSENDTIFCNGAFLKPVEVEIKGRKQWRWMLVGSEDDSFLDGERVSVYDYADDLQGLIAENN
ncbi:MAG: hypothetical protein ACR2NQ_04835 [Thermodesulfobacteriota bacterium]